MKSLTALTLPSASAASPVSSPTLPSHEPALQPRNPSKPGDGPAPVPQRAYEADPTSVQVIEFGSLLPPTTVRLATDNTMRDNRPRAEPRVLGKGAFATLYAATEHIVPDTPHAPHARALTREVAVKVFNHAQGDWQSVFYSELTAYRQLSPHKNFVDVRGAVEYMPPTFVCSRHECGQTFQVPHCPACLARGVSSRLRNDPTGLALVCSESHRYTPDIPQALTALRPCGHTDECAAINFLVRPYVFLEQLTMSVEQMNTQLLPERSHPGVAGFIFESRSESDRKREVLLLRLDVLLGCAEGLAHCHEKQQVFIDLKPDNVMVQLARQGPNVPTALTAVKLIDPGRVRSIKERRTSATPVGDATFLAPEQSADPHQIGQVRVRFLCSTPRAGDLCVLETPDGRRLDLEPGDYVFNDESSYEIVHLGSLPANDRTALGADPERIRGRCARIIVPPPADAAAQVVYLQYHQAVSIPADIYSFGCFAAWFLSGGKQEFVKTLRACADLATLKRRVVDERCLDELLGEERHSIAHELVLPETGFDDRIRSELLLLLLRCLVRSEGTYCRHRSYEFANPARDVARDLKLARQKLAVIYRTRSECDALDLDELEAAESARQQAEFARRRAELEQRCDDLHKQNAQLEKQTATQAKRAHRGHLWHTAIFFLLLLAVPVAVIAVAVARTHTNGTTQPSSQQSPPDLSRLPQPAQDLQRPSHDNPATAIDRPSSSKASPTGDKTPLPDRSKVPDVRQALTSAADYAKRRGFELVVAGGKGSMIITQSPVPGADAPVDRKIRVILGELEVGTTPPAERTKR